MLDALVVCTLVIRNEEALLKLAGGFASQYQFESVNPAQQAFVMLREGGILLRGTRKTGRLFYGISGKSSNISRADIAKRLGLKVIV